MRIERVARVHSRIVQGAVARRINYACRGCEKHVAIAAPVPKLIEKWLPGPCLLAHTTLPKIGDHLPLYRLEDIASHSGIVLRRSTLCDWIARAAELAEPLYRHMMVRVLASQVLHTDDTKLKMLDPPFHPERPGSSGLTKLICRVRNPLSRAVIRRAASHDNAFGSL